MKAQDFIELNGQRILKVIFFQSKKGGEINQPTSLSLKIGGHQKGGRQKMDRLFAGRRRRGIIHTDTVKYFSEPEIRALRKIAREECEADESKGRVTGIRNWMIVDLLTMTGLRVHEAASLECGNIKIGYCQSELYIEDSKDGVSGSVVIPPSLRTHLRSYLVWKMSQGEGTNPSDPLFIGKKGPMTSQALQFIVKRYLKRLGIYQRGKSCHSLRHSYAVALYRKEKDLRTVQKQLRHVSIQSTLIYADVGKDEIYEQVKNLWGR